MDCTVFLILKAECVLCITTKLSRPGLKLHTEIVNAMLGHVTCNTVR